MSDIFPHKDKGHLWKYHCDKHNAGHSGVCASCYFEKQDEDREEYVQGLRDENKRLTAEVERLQLKVSRLEGALMQVPYGIEALKNIAEIESHD